jgi:hypothetical protein
MKFKNEIVKFRPSPVGGVLNDSLSRVSAWAMQDEIENERHTHQCTVRRMRRHHTLHLLQCVTELSITLLRRGGRFSVEGSESDDLVNNDAATGSP